MIHPAVNVPYDRLREYCRSHGIREMALFGSAIRPDFDPGRSDVDVLVNFDEDAPIGLIEYCRIQDELSELLGRKVDLVEKAGLKPAVRDNVLREAEVVYAG